MLVDAILVHDLIFLRQFRSQFQNWQFKGLNMEIFGWLCVNG